MPVWTTPPSFTANQSAGVAAGLQTMSDDLALIGGAWASYTPLITTGGVAITLGNGSIDAAYKLLGDKTVCWRAALAVGSTTVLPAGTVVIGLPVNAKASVNGHAVGSYVTSAPIGQGAWKNNAASSVQLFNGSTLQTVATLGLTTGTVLFVGGTYEGA